MKSAFRNIDFSIIHPMIYPDVSSGDGPILETLEKIMESCMFKAVEVTNINNHLVRKEVLELMKEHHVYISFCAAPPILSRGLDISSLDKDIRKWSVEQLKELMIQACELEAKYFTVLSGKDPGSRWRKDAYCALKESLAELCDFAAELDKENPIIVTLETFDRNIDKRCLAGPTIEILDICKDLSNINNFGLTLDQSHLILLNENPIDSLELAKDHLATVHVGNCVTKTSSIAYGDNHPRFGYPDSRVGLNNLFEFLIRCEQIAGKKNINLMVSFEVKPQKGEQPDIVLETVIQTICEAAERMASKE